MDLNIHRNEIEQFLCDVRDHLNNNLDGTEYQNTTHIFNGNESVNAKLLQRCQQILEYVALCPTDNDSHTVKNSNGYSINHAAYSATSQLLSKSKGNCSAILEEVEDISYLDMTSGGTKPATVSTDEYIDFTDSSQSDKSFEDKTAIVNGCKLPMQRSVENCDDNDETFDYDPSIYDTCNIPFSESDETLKAKSNTNCSAETNHVIDCPYAGLPAAHLGIQKSAKFGPLLRIIEKRLFFDQSKKYYCGIVGDWLLCYCDGPTSLKPSTSLHLKSNGVEVEHYGEGKRRDICFQITTFDPNKKFIFHSISEVDAKEWIHAIEAAIRGDSISQHSPTTTRTSRKLPTPPTQRKSLFNRDETNCNHNDCIYEEPSPLYNIQSPTDLLIAKNSADLNPSNGGDIEQDSKLEMMVKKFEYDVPKSPPQPLLLAAVESETAELLKENATSSSPNRASISQCDFQTKIKDVHSKLSNQLSSSGPSPELLKKGAKKSSLHDSEAVTLTQHMPHLNKEQKKTKRSLSLSPSQKNSFSSTKLTPTINEKSTRNWFLNRLNKTTSSARNSTVSVVSPAKCKQSEKENLLNNLEMGDNCEGPDLSSNGSSPTTSPSFKCGKVNMIINRFEASGQLATVFSADSFNCAGTNGANSSNSMKFSSFCENDSNNYEPIMAGPTPSTNSFMKKV